MLKYLQTVKDRLSGLKTGMANNAAAWASQTDTPATVQAEIAELENVDNEIELLKDQLKQKQMEARQLADQKRIAAQVIEKKAIGIHATSAGKLVEYNITVAAGPGAARPLPKKALIKSVIDNKDGVGFRIFMQRQGGLVDFWEIERGEIVPTAIASNSVTDGATTVLQPPYPFLKSTKRLVYIDSKVVANVRYFYRVRGVNATGEGAWSEPVSAVQ